jgi:hypothetical protein
MAGVTMVALVGCDAPDYEVVREQPTVVVEVPAELFDKEAVDVIEDVRTDPALRRAAGVAAVPQPT